MSLSQRDCEAIMQRPDCGLIYVGNRLPLPEVPDGYTVERVPGWREAKIRRSGFNAELFELIVREIAGWSTGTLAMSRDCLWQCISPRLVSCEHAPVGTNARWVARQVFDALLDACPLFRRRVFED